jgi:transitional endoplasmic reticulum ATPase
MHLVDFLKDMINAEVLNSLTGRVTMTMNNFCFALGTSNPSDLCETVINFPQVSWDDIGGLKRVKQEPQGTAILN